MNKPLKHIKKDLSLPLSVFIASSSLSIFLLSVSKSVDFPGWIVLTGQIISYVPYGILLYGIVLNWKLNNTGLLLTAFSLALMYLATQSFAPPIYGLKTLEPAVTKAALYLFPVNMIAFSMMIKRRVFTRLGSLYLFLFFVQVAFVVTLFNSQGALLEFFSSILFFYSKWLKLKTMNMSIFLTSTMNGMSFLSCILVFLWTLVFLFIRYVYKRDVGLAGFTMILVSGVAGVLAAGTPTSSFIFFLAAGLLVVIASLEGSFVLSDHDPVTGLPGRKSLTSLIHSLKTAYAIAFVDIDRFNEFNDRYGPDIGDDVLRIVSDKLADLSGNVTVFRYGGDEFLAVFQGCDHQDVLNILDDFRGKIESFPFLVKARTDSSKRTTTKNGNAVSSAHVSLSIGLSTSAYFRKASDVLKNADKALCRAKDEGRNRVVVCEPDFKK